MSIKKDTTSPPAAAEVAAGTPPTTSPASSNTPPPDAPAKPVKNVVKAAVKSNGDEEEQPDVQIDPLQEAMESVEAAMNAATKSVADAVAGMSNQN